MSDKLKKHGLPEDYFDKVDREKVSNEKTHELCKWIRDNKRNPSAASSGKVEKRLHSFIQSHRKQPGRAAGSTGCVYYKSNEVILLSYGLEGLFDEIDREKESNTRVYEICEFIKKNGKKPSQQSKDKNEKSLYTFIMNKRASGLGLAAGVKLYETDKKIAKDYGFSDLFTSKARASRLAPEAQSNKNVHKLCKFIVKNNREPVGSSKEKDEKFLNHILKVERSIKMGAARVRRYKFYPSDQVIAESYGLNDLFEISGKERGSNKKTNELCKWIIRNEKYPMSNCKDLKEKELYALIQSRFANKMKTHSSDQAIAESYGLNDLFEISGMERKSNQRAHQTCKFKKEHKRNPQNKSSKERELSAWLLQRKYAKTHPLRCFYPSDQAIAESYGFNDLFKTRTEK